jgi:hypothetical protein
MKITLWDRVQWTVVGVLCRITLRLYEFASAMAKWCDRRMIYLIRVRQRMLDRRQKP